MIFDLIANGISGDCRRIRAFEMLKIYRLKCVVSITLEYMRGKRFYDKKRTL